MQRFILSSIVMSVFAIVSPAAPPRYFGDATLRAVKFIDANEGWACGDDGVIWHTIDSGTTWERQPTGVRASLRGISFVTPYTGWVVGREELPGGVSAGVVLATTDGGLKWTRLAMNTFPGLHAVRFFSDQEGIVAGDGSDRFGSGVFTTRDGGRTWAAVNGPRSPGWRSADFGDDRNGVMGGVWGSLSSFRNGAVVSTSDKTLDDRTVSNVSIYQTTAVAVGQSGLVLRGQPATNTWQDVSPRTLLGSAISDVDFQGVAVFGEHAWVVGRPGSMVLHTRDEGRTWAVQSTGVDVPLHAVHFHDANMGWAVGDLGSIIGTTDGGQTWKVQRRSGERAAAMLMHAMPSAVALDALAQLGSDEGYLTVALSLFSADPATAPAWQAAMLERLSAAVRLAGGAAAQCLAKSYVSEYFLDLETTNPAVADAIAPRKASLVRQLTLAIRCWRPEVIIGDEPTDALTSVTAELVREAFRLAADPNAFPEQIQTLRLKPWAVKKLLITSDASRNRTHPIRMNGTEPMSRCAESARVVGLVAADALGDAVSVLSERGFTLIENRLPNGAGAASIFDGIILAHGGTARREVPALTVAEIEARDEQIKQLQIRRNIEALARPDWKAISGPDQLIGQLGSMLRTLPAEQGARAAYSVARAFVSSGQWSLACEAFALLASRYPADSLAVESYRWIAQYSGSAEARRRYELNQFISASEVGVKQVRADSGSDLQHPSNKNWHAAALGLEGRMAVFGPLYLHEPAFQLSLQTARRALGQDEAANKWVTSFVRERREGADVWRDAAAAELWAATRSGQNPRPVGSCVSTPQPPKLDGKLDEDCWSSAREMPLSTVMGTLDMAYAAKAMVARDAKHLYLAIQCTHPAGKQVPRAEKRQRDEDLKAFDRVGIMLDVDRDWQTAFHLQIDQRGCLSEDCWGDRSWNPKWYVAIQSDATSWTIEAAIPLSELTGDPITNGRSWAFNIYRVVPGRGVMAWSSPAGLTPRPEGAGILMFTEDRQ